MSNEPTGDLDRTRTTEQRAAYEKTVGQGHCPFCGERKDLPEEIQERMIFEGNHWRAWYNPFPYPNHVAHIILAPIHHLTQPSDVTPEAASEWMALNAHLIETLNLPGGGLVMRFGNHEYKGGSITHLHSHIQVPDQLGYSIAVFYLDKELESFLFPEKTT
jgi:diadenosine tetraphosphate (Ap4A) HIT family hydrolase